MTVESILLEIDSEISRLQQVRALLSGAERRAKPTGATSPTRKRRKLSAAARNKIAAAQKARWAKQKAQK